VESWRRQQCDAVRFCSRSLLALASFSLARPLDSIIALACLQSSLARLSLCQFPPPLKAEIGTRASYLLPWRPLAHLEHPLDRLAGRRPTEDTMSH